MFIFIIDLCLLNKFYIFLMQEAFVTSDEFGQDLEHVEALQKKFDEFQKV